MISSARASAFAITRGSTLLVVGAALALVCAACGDAGVRTPGPTTTSTQIATSSPGVRLSGDQFWATLPSQVQASICSQVRADPAAALDIAASYAAANPVFRSQLVATIRAKCG